MQTPRWPWVGLLQRCLDLLGHDVESLVPGDRRELAVLVVLAIFHAQQRLRQAILAILDLGEEVTLDAVEATVDRRFRVTLRGDDAAILGADQHAAASTAVAAGALVPAYAVVLALGLPEPLPERRCQRWQPPQLLRCS